MRKPPRSKAKTAWGLLQDVKRVILAEPRRVDMRTFYGKRHPENGGPACGMVGCFAGWVSMLKGGRSYFTADAHAHARQLLGHCNYYTAGRQNLNVFNCDGNDIRGTIGTKRYARSVVGRITKFMRINETVLKAKRV